MQHLLRLLPHLALACLLGSCLENEEVIEIRPDGSLTVTLSSKGDVGDLVTGYAVPFDGAFAPANAEAEAWLARMGPDTGGPEVQARWNELGDAALGRKDDEGTKLVVRGEFASVEDLPRWFAPANEPYRTAHLERTATLRIEDKGDRTVYVFERTFHGRPFERYDLLDDVDQDLPEAVRAKLEQLQPLGAAELDVLASEIRTRSLEVAELQVRDAFELAFVEAAAAPPPTALETTLYDVLADGARYLDDARIGRLYDDCRAWDALGDDDDDRGPHPLEAFEAASREAFRASLAASLEAQNVSAPARHAVMYALEWGFTSLDHTVDLGDEKWKVRVSMPGTIVGGSFSSLEDGYAVFELEGEDLRDADRVLRVVSVLPR